MSYLAGRKRPQPFLTIETRLNPLEYTSVSEEAKVANGPGFHCSDCRPSVSTILSTAKPTLGQTGCTEPGGPRGTRYQHHNFQSVGETTRTCSSREGKAKKKNGFSFHFGRFSWTFVFQSRWMAFLALLAILETKAGMTPRVAAFRVDDGRQLLSVEPSKVDPYTLRFGSRSNDTLLGWRRFDFLKNNERVRKGHLSSSLGVVELPTLRMRSSRKRKRRNSKETGGKRHQSIDVIRPYDGRAPRERHNRYKTHHQHYNYYHPHYHHSNEHHRPRHHKKHHIHNRDIPATPKEKGEEYENDDAGVFVEYENSDGGLVEESEIDGPEYVHRRPRRSVDTGAEDIGEMDPLERLSRVFGIRRFPSDIGPSPNQIPPEYMTGLYRSITDSGGLTKTNGPYNADIVRSFPDRDYRHRMHFFYNVSFLETNERILQAEFHLFKLRPKNPQPKKTNNPHLISIEIHQVLSLKEDVYNPENLKLIDMRRVSAYSHGWITFTVLKAVNSWVNNTSPNYGFLVKATSMAGESFNGTLVRFAQRKEHHDTKQPILVVFTDDGLQKHRNFISPNDEGYQEIKRDILRHEQLENQERNQGLQKAIRLLNEKERTEYQQQKHNPYWGHGFKRKRRSAPNAPLKEGGHKSHGESRNSTSGHGRNRRTLFRRKRRNCARYEMYVDFNAIGWSGWIISPKGYNAYHCSGPCPFPLGQSHRPTNHATVQSIVHALRAGKNVLTPCCVPDKLYSISLLYFDDQENVILKLYEDMVAASCGCH